MNTPQTHTGTTASKRRLILAALPLWAAACSTGAPAPMSVPAPTPRPDASILVGTWTVDLRPNPDAPAYLKSLVVTAVDGKRFEGSFYDTPITEGRINVDWGTVRIAFVTADRSGSYNHSAVLTDGRLEGLTNSLGRNFLACWRATKS